MKFVVETDKIAYNISFNHPYVPPAEGWSEDAIFEAFVDVIAQMDWALLTRTDGVKIALNTSFIRAIIPAKETK